MITVDLRSDTITKPTRLMQEAMWSAAVGDDVFGDDPSINALEAKAAKLFGMEAALFCTSGTMTNQIAIRVHTTPGSEVICDKLSHIYLYEGGGVALNSLASVRLLEGDRGRLTATMVKESINNPNDIHQSPSSLVSLENTMNKGGGAYYQWAEMVSIHQVCQENQLKFHLDGARLFNALVETKENPEDYGAIFDSISICLSKGLGCPVGSLLLGSADFIKKARRFRKVMGGGWRQAGFLAAAGIYALDNHIDRLKEDHQRAKAIGEILIKLPFVEQILPIDTNIVIFDLPKSILATTFVQQMNQLGIACVAFGKHSVRFVTHLDFSDNHLEIFESQIKKIQL